MANEIVTLKFRKRRRGAAWEGLFLYPIVPPITTPDAMPIPITPSAALPLNVQQLGVFSTAEIDAFNGGTLMYSFEAVDLTDAEDDNRASREAKLRAEYAERDPVAATRREWRAFGRRLDAS